MSSKELIRVGAAVVAAGAVYGGASLVVQAEEVSDTTPIVDNDSSVNVVNNVVDETKTISSSEKKNDNEIVQPKLQEGWNEEKNGYIVDGNYLNSSFQEIDGNTYYFDEYGYKVTGDKQIDGITYAFDENGVLVVEDVDNSITTLELTSNERATVINGMKNENGKLYFYSNGTRVYGDQTVDGKVYNFKEDGTILKGFLENGTSLKYYNESGVRVTGTFTIGKVTYYADSNGEIYKSVINNVSYYCQQSGSWAWSVVGGYYFSGTGCVPTTVTMIVNSLNGTNYTPIQVGNTLHANGYFNNGEEGTTSDVWRFVANNYGLSYSNNLDYNTAYQKLKEGNFVAAAVGYGSYWCPWKGSTHQILMCGIDQNGYTTVYDPYTSSRNGTFKLSDIFAHPSDSYGDLRDGGPFFSLGSMTTNSLYNYSITSSSASHVGNKYYTGNAVEPEVNLTVKGVSLQQGKDYVVSYSNNVNVGKATVTIQGMGRYTGTIVTSFDVLKDEFNGNGTYEIHSGLNNNMVIDVPLSSHDYGKELQLYTSNGSMAQQFKIEKNQYGYYTIQNIESTLYVGVNGNVSGLGNGTGFIQGLDKNSKGAQFIFVKDSNGRFVITSAWDKNYVIDLSSSNTNNGAHVQFWSGNNTNAQSWRLVKVVSGREKMDQLAAENRGLINDGLYEIQSGINSRYVLDMSSSSMVNGGNLQIYQSNGTNAQRWKVTHDDKGYITITNVNSGKVIDVAFSRAANLTNVQQYTSNGSLAQKWIAVKKGNGFELLSALNNNYVLDLFSSKTVNGNNIDIYSRNGSKAQMWIFEKKIDPREELNNLASTNKNVIENGVYEIQSSINSGFVLDMSASSKADGGNLQIYQSNGTNAQRWKIVHDDKGYITIINVNSNKAIDVTYSNASNLTNVQQYSSNGSWAQKWIAVKNGNGIELVSALNKNYVLDLFSSRTVNGNNIDIYQRNNSNAQKWYFKKK